MPKPNFLSTKQKEMATNRTPHFESDALDQDIAIVLSRFHSSVHLHYQNYAALSMDSVNVSGLGSDLAIDFLSLGNNVAAGFDQSCSSTHSISYRTL